MRHRRRSATGKQPFGAELWGLPGDLIRVGRARRESLPFRGRCLHMLRDLMIHVSGAQQGPALC